MQVNYMYASSLEGVVQADWIILMNIVIHIFNKHFTIYFWILFERHSWRSPEVKDLLMHDGASLKPAND